MQKKAILILALAAISITLLVRRLFASGSALWIEDIVDDLPRSGQYSRRSLSDISRIVLHHSASENQDAWDYAAYHVSHHGWPGIGYHYVIQPDGSTYQTNYLDSISYHVKNHNTPSVGICLSGNFDQHPPSSEQKQSLRRLIALLEKTLANPLEIVGHRDLVSTSCPGKHFEF